MKDRLASVEDELRVTKENLQATIEEMETSNEELQATNEELIASNEELQSTNEELHSVNEELYTVNAEYQAKIAELTELTVDMNHLLEATEVHTVFLDSKLRLRKFTPRDRETFNLCPRTSAAASTPSPTTWPTTSWWGPRAGGGRRPPIEREVQDGKKNSYFMRLLPYRTSQAGTDGVVLTLVDISGIKQAQRNLAISEERYRALVRASAILWIADRNGGFARPPIRVGEVHRPGLGGPARRRLVRRLSPRRSGPGARRLAERAARAAAVRGPGAPLQQGPRRLPALRGPGRSRRRRARPAARVGGRHHRRPRLPGVAAAAAAAGGPDPGHPPPLARLHLGQGPERPVPGGQPAVPGGDGDALPGPGGQDRLRGAAGGGGRPAPRHRARVPGERRDHRGRGAHPRRQAAHLPDREVPAARRAEPGLRPGGHLHRHHRAQAGRRGDPQGGGAAGPVPGHAVARAAHAAGGHPQRRRPAGEGERDPPAQLCPRRHPAADPAHGQAGRGPAGRGAGDPRPAGAGRPVAGRAVHRRGGRGHGAARGRAPGPAAGAGARRGGAAGARRRGPPAPDLHQPHHQRRRLHPQRARGGQHAQRRPQRRRGGARHRDRPVARGAVPGVRAVLPDAPGAGPQARRAGGGPDPGPQAGPPARRRHHRRTARAPAPARPSR